MVLRPSRPQSPQSCRIMVRFIDPLILQRHTYDKAHVRVANVHLRLTAHYGQPKHWRHGRGYQTYSIQSYDLTLAADGQSRVVVDVQLSLQRDAQQHTYLQSNFNPPPPLHGCASQLAYGCRLTSSHLYDSSGSGHYSKLLPYGGICSMTTLL